MIRHRCVGTERAYLPLMLHHSPADGNNVLLVMRTMIAAVTSSVQNSALAHTPSRENTVGAEAVGSAISMTPVVCCGTDAPALITAEMPFGVARSHKTVRLGTLTDWGGD